MDDFIMNTPTGICSQEDFDHDFQHLVHLIRLSNTNKSLKHMLDQDAYILVKMAVEKGYKINW